MLDFLSCTETNSYNFTVNKDGYVSLTFTISPALAQSSVYLGLKQTNAVLAVTFKDESGVQKTIGPSESGSISCYPRNGAGGGYWQYFSSGQTGGELSIGDGNYRCSAGISGYPAFSFDFDVAPGETRAVEVPVLYPSANIRISLVTAAGVPYPVVKAGNYIYCSSANGIYSQSVPIPAGASYLDFAVVPGTYSCNTYLPDVTTGVANVVAVSGAFAEATMVVTVPDATITVSLFDSITLEPIAALANDQAQISCYDNTNQRGFYKFFQKGEASSVLGVVAGTYNCSLYFPGTRSDSFTAQVSSGVNADYSVRIEKLSSVIHFSLQRSSGSVFTIPNLAGSWAQISCTNLPGRSKWYSSALNQGDTDSKVNLVPGRYSCRLNSELFSSDEIEIDVPGTGEVSVSLSVIEYSTPVTFSLVNEQGGFVVPPNSTSANIYCSEPGGRYKYLTVAANTHSMTTNFGEGDYSCSLSGSGVSSDPFDLILQENESALQINIRVSTGSAPLTVNLYNADTQLPLVIGPDQYAELACWNQFDTFSRFSSRYESQNSSATIYLPEGTFDCSVYLQGFAAEQFRVVAQSGTSITQNVQMLPPDSFIRTRLLRGNTDQNFTVPDGVSGYLSCRIDKNESQGIYFGGQINPGDSIVTLAVRSGTYICSVWIPGYGASHFSASVSARATTDGVSRIYSESSPVDVQVINKSTGVPASGIPLRIYASTRNRMDQSTQLQHWQEVLTENGVARLNLIPDLNYEIGVRIDESYGATTTRSLVLPDALTLITTSAQGIPQTVTLEATETRTFVEVKFLYPDGTNVKRGWANISSVVSSPDEIPQWEGAQVIDGKARIPAIPGKPYLVSVYQAFEEKKEWIEPKPEPVTLTEGETRLVTFVLSRPNYELNVNVVIKGTPPSTVPEVFCYTFDNHDRQSYAQLDSTLKASIPLVVNETTNAVEVSCSAFYPDLINDFGLSFWGRATYVPAQGSNSGSVTVEVNEFGRYYEQEAYTFDAAYGASFTLQDGLTRIEIPAKAVADSGNAKMYVGSATGYSFANDSFPLLSFDIKFEVDGKLVSDMAKPVTLRFPVDEVQLTKLGGSIDNLKAGSFEDGSRVWRQDAVYAYDSASKVLSVSVSHFTIWGLLVDLLSKLTEKSPPTVEPGGPTPTPTQGAVLVNIPSELIAKRIRNGKNRKVAPGTYPYRICWEAPVGSSTSTVYELQLLVTGRKGGGNKKSNTIMVSSKAELNWNKATLSNSRKTCINKNIRAGMAYARARIKGGEFSEIISFRVGGK